MDRRRRPVDPRVRPRLVPDRAAPRARGGAARRRLERHDGVGRGRAREGARPRKDDPHDAARQRALVPLQVLRRQLHAPVRLRRAPDEAADGGGTAPREARRGSDVPAVVTISSHQKVGEAIDIMQRYSISQLPVVRDGENESLADVIGSLQDRDLLDRVFKNSDALHEDVASAMQPPLAAVEITQSLDEVFSTLTGRTNAVVVARDGKPVGVLTRSDLLESLAHNRS